MSQFKTKQFRRLQHQFYKKLKDTGFEDIEEINSSKEMLKTWASNIKPDRHRSAEYFDQANDFYYTFSFDSEKDKDVWRHHADGESVRQIERHYNRRGYRKSTVAKIVWRLSRIMLKKEEYIHKEDLITTRGLHMDDVNFIIVTWLKGLYYGNSWFREIDKNAFMSSYEKVIKQLLIKPGTDVVVSCYKDDPEVILGYAIIENQTLHWAYVKDDWRRIGILKSILPSDITHVTHLTDLGKQIKPKEWIFNPFLI